LIDGEMVVDTIPGGGLKRRYLAYDLMAINFASKVKVETAKCIILIDKSKFLILR
jgi:mRNA-capping enzyme